MRAMHRGLLLAAGDIGAQGLLVDHGTSCVQTVTFDEHGPVAPALLTYGQRSDPPAPQGFDHRRQYSCQQRLTLPFHADEVAQARIGPVLVLVAQRPSFAARRGHLAAN